VKSAPPRVNVRPKKRSSLGRPEKVRSLETMWVKANAMFSVPSVTMKAGSRRPATRLPFSMPKPTQARMPRSNAWSGGTPLATASFVITIWPNAITVPHERSIPAVRITNVWPIASTPTTITCWSTSERFCVCRKRSLFKEKNAMVSRSAIRGPTAGAVAILRRSWSGVARGCSAEVVSTVLTRLEPKRS
jgi:hypothetical protein